MHGYYAGVKVTKEEVQPLVEDVKRIENFERVPQSGFDYQTYPATVKEKSHTSGELVHGLITADAALAAVH